VEPVTLNPPHELHQILTDVAELLFYLQTQIENDGSEQRNPPDVGH